VSTQTETMFLQLPGITGGAQDPKFKNQLAVDSLTWSIGGITDLHASASQLSQQCYTKVFIGDVSIQRKMCVGSPSVLSIFQKRTAFATGTITAVISGSVQLVYNLTGVSIPQYTQNVANQVPTESLILHFAEMKMTYAGASFSYKAYTTTGT
jgi:type VI protein secretion system component Hcp